MTEVVEKSCYYCILKPWRFVILSYHDVNLQYITHFNNSNQEEDKGGRRGEGGEGDLGVLATQLSFQSCC